VQLSALSTEDRSYNELSSTYSKSYSLTDLGQNGSVALQGSESQVSFYFGSRLDEVVLGASLDFTYTPSPALIALVSHLKIYLNEELMVVIPIKKGMQGKKFTEKIALDPRFLRNSNQLKFELTGKDDPFCYNPSSTSIWAEISALTQLKLNIKKVELNSDLSLLPAPFFDQRDYSSVSLSFVIPENLDLQSIKAVGVAASYFGSLAKWRKINLSVMTDILPQQHSIVFATNEHKPYFIRNIPDVDRPTIQIITHPTIPYLKMLLILGKDSDGLNAAVQALALGDSLMTGNIAYVNKINNIAPRKPYDAPNWIDTTRPVSFSELVDKHNQLQTTGLRAEPIDLSFNLPPDLFTWQSQGIPLDLAYRYSPPIQENSGSRLSVSINGQFVEAFTLSKSGRNSDDKRIKVPLLDDNILSTNSNVDLPAFRVGSNNNIAFEFGFASDSVQCKSFQSSTNFGVIDANSSMDFSDLPHYIKMPNMGAFASSGYPYTRIADLSETIMLMKEQPSLSEIELFINVMAFMGRKSGLPGFRLTVSDSWNEKTLADKDIILLGTYQDLPVFNNNEQAHLAFQNMNRILQRPAQEEKKQGDIWQQKDFSATPVTDFINISASGPFASMVAFESPFTATRTVTVLSAQQDSSLKLISDAIGDEGQLHLMFGSTTALQLNKLSSFDVGEAYYLGHLPVYKLVWFHFSEYPVLLALMVFLITALLTIFLWRMLHLVAERRLKGGK